MLKKVFLIAFLSLFVKGNVYATSFCCGDEKIATGSANNPKLCVEFSCFETCDYTLDSGEEIVLRPCKSENDKVDENGEAYNSDCFINIEPPEQIKITDFGRLFSGAVSFLLLIAFILAFFFLVLGGIVWLTSGGDKGNIESARNKIIAAIIGLIIVAATWAIFQLVGGAIGFNILGGFEIPTLY